MNWLSPWPIIPNRISLLWNIEIYELNYELLTAFRHTRLHSDVSASSNTRAQILIFISLPKDTSLSDPPINREKFCSNIETSDMIYQMYESKWDEQMPVKQFDENLLLMSIWMPLNYFTSQTIGLIAYNIPIGPSSSLLPLVFPSEVCSMSTGAWCAWHISTSLVLTECSSEICKWFSIRRWYHI